MIIYLHKFLAKFLKNEKLVVRNPNDINVKLIFTLNIERAVAIAPSFPFSYTVVLQMFPAIKVPVLTATSLAIFSAFKFSSLTSFSRPMTFSFSRCP